MGIGEEKSEEVRQNDGGKIMQTRSGFSYHFADNHFAWSLLFIHLSLLVHPSRILLPEKQDLTHAQYR